MDIRDLIVTPFVLVIVYAIAYVFKPWFTDSVNQNYFIPALTARILGALALGFIYQFYYGGGDTFNFHTYGSRHIWEAFFDSPEKALKILFSDGNDQTGIYKYTSQIPFYRDNSSFTIIRLAGIIDLFTFSTYSSTAIIFAVLSFIGSWMLFLAFYREYPQLHYQIALASLFIPSVFFWGSGLLKDTVTLACLGVATFLIREIFIIRSTRIFHIIILLLSFYIIYSIKKYILLCYLPAALVWVSTTRLAKVKSLVLKIMIAPIAIVLTCVMAYLAVDQVSKDDPRYALDQLGNTARITAYDIAYQTGRDAGSTYSLGELDGTFSGLVKLAPQAINVSLFRPYLWEVRNPLMLMSALESLLLLFLTVFVFFKSYGYISKNLMAPYVVFCLIFSLSFAFAVGVSTFNFGTLSRYKIPLLPFYCLMLLILYYHSNKAKKFFVFDKTE